MSNKEIVRFLKPFLMKEKKSILLAIFFALFSSLIGVTYGYLSGYAINAASEMAVKVAVITLLINLSLSIVNYAFFSRLSVLVSTRLSFRVIQNISFVLFHKVLKLPTKAFEEKSSGEFINRITTDSETITDSISSLLQILIRVLTSMLVFFYCLFNSFWVALEILVYLVVLYKITGNYRPKLKEFQKKIKEQNDEYVAQIDEDIHGIREIRALGIHENIFKHLKEIVESLFCKRDDTIRYEQNYYAFVYILDEVLVAVVFITIIVLILMEKSTLTFLVAMSYYIYNFMNLVNSFASFSTYYQKLKVAVERIHEIIDNTLYQDMLFGEYHNLSPVGSIDFRNVTFQYHDNKKKILEHFDLHIKENTKVAIIGKSGQGKSTIFNLLLRYFDVTKGKVLLDGVSICEYDEESLRKNISIIRQDPFLFHKTILENFKMVNPKITLKEVRKYCKEALLDDYIMSLPHKYNTKIGEGGVNLSGGQKQRLAIARALSKNSKIILFDEATSALDNESQEKIIEVIREISKDHTILTIAHRLSTIIDSDVIHIMDEGRIVASGTHEELLKSNSIYQDLYKNNA